MAATAHSATDPFSLLQAAMAGAPLHEVAPARSGDGVAALGFALALARGRQGATGLVFVGARTWEGEEGRLSPRGLSAFGLDLKALLAVHVRTGKEALWAAEQALEAPGAAVVCALADRDVDLTASRRLLLKAERTGAHAVLVRAGAGGGASAAFTRWRIAPAPSDAEARLLGRPAWRASLARHRGGAAGAQFQLEWDDGRLRSALPCDLAEASADRPAAAAA